MGSGKTEEEGRVGGWPAAVGGRGLEVGDGGSRARQAWPRAGEGNLGLGSGPQVGQGPAQGTLRTRPQEEELSKGVTVEGRSQGTSRRYRTPL